MQPFVILSLIILCNSQGRTQESSKAIIARANFIFAGTIVTPNASNIGIKTSSPTAIVRVDEIIDAVAPYDQMKGKEITVLFASTASKAAGSQQVFYTMGWYYGKNLGVKEVANDLPRQTPDTLKRVVALQRQAIHRDSLVAELSKATLVIRGVVTAIEVEARRNPAIESEHDPDLRRAVISIQEVLKGKIAAKQVTVYYSASEDVQWHRAPKLSKGQQGIFLLSSGQLPESIRVEGYTVLDKRDVQLVTSLPDLKVLLKN
jgi:hypothetical protein